MKKKHWFPIFVGSVLNKNRTMKLSFLLFALVLFNSYANSYGQNKRLSLDITNKSIESVLEKIEFKSKFNFFYKTEEIDVKRKVTIDVVDTPIKEILDILFKNQDVSYKVVKKQIVLKRNTAVSIPSSDNDVRNQPNPIVQHSISGTISDSNGNPLPGANIVEKGSTNGVTADFDGNFSLNLANENATLLVSYIGFATKEVAVNGQNTIDISLEESAAGLDEVVVIGYGSREKKDITTSISTVESDVIDKSVSLTPELAMQGTMTGVFVSGNSGNPLSRPTVRIRGVNTWGVSSPLYVVDGVPITELGSGVEGTDARVSDVRGPINIMSMIDPNDIESISVLKDASAAAIYGVRASNGVVLVTTKRGKTATPTIEFDSRFGFQNIANTWDVLNTQQYIEFYRNSFAANPNFTLEPVFDPTSPQYLGNTRETYDWQSSIINRDATVENHSVRISGRTDATNYYASGSYASTEGVVNGVSLDRYSFNVKLDNSFNNWLNTGINFRLAYVEGEDEGSNLTDSALTPPWQPIYDANGPDFLQGFAQIVPGFDENGNWVSEQLYGEASGENSLGIAALNNRQYNSLRNLGNAFVEIKPLKGLSIKGNFSVDWYKHDRKLFRDYNQAYFRVGGSPNDKGGGNSVGDYGENFTTNVNIIKELTIHYNTTFGKHNLDLLASGMDQQYSAKYISAQTDFITTRDPNQWTVGGNNEFTLVESELFRWALQGLLGRASYNYANKYYLDATVRRDGSNRFAPDKRWGTFPSASVAWRISSEPIMENVKWLTDLKFRAGWGQLGNQEVRPLAYLSPVEQRPTYAFGSFPGSDGLGNYSVGAALFSFPNADLEWEKTTTTNIGLDAIIAQNLSASLEYYHKETDGILQETSIPSSVGSKENPVANIASVRNQGFEMSLNYTGKIGEVNFNVGGNITTVKNEVLSTYEGIPIGGDLRIEEGYPINFIYGYKEGGIFQNQQEIDAYTQTTQDLTISQDFQPGDRYFLDINGPPDSENGFDFYTPGPDGVVNQFDRTYLGKTIPGFYYGLNFGLDYKGFDLSGILQGVGDIQRYNNAYATMTQTATRGNNLSVDVLNSWTAENQSTRFARAVVGDPNGSLRFSSRYVEDASYFRLSNLQLGYTFPKAILAPMDDLVRYLRFYVSVNNAFTITDWHGLNPEDDGQPVPRVVSFGVSAKF